MRSPLIMVVSHRIEIHQAFASALAPLGFAPVLASTVCEAMAIISHHPISLVFCSDELPGDGIDILIRKSSRFGNRVPVVVISRLDDWDRYLDFLHYGAFDYVLYPLTCGEVEQVVNNASSLVASTRSKCLRSIRQRPRRAQVLSPLY
jgi:DNA-binding NtrC family response regulator